MKNNNSKNSNATQVIQATREAGPFDPSWPKFDTVLQIAGTYFRHGVGAVLEGHSGRKVDQGPRVPGPWAYAFPLCTSISSSPEMGTGADIKRNKAAGVEFTVDEGDLVEVEGVVYRVKLDRRQWIKLEAVEESQK